MKTIRQRIQELEAIIAQQKKAEAFAETATENLLAEVREEFGGAYTADLDAPRKIVIRRTTTSFERTVTVIPINEKHCKYEIQGDADGNYLIDLDRDAMLDEIIKFCDPALAPVIEKVAI